MANPKLRKYIYTCQLYLRGNGVEDEGKFDYEDENTRTLLYSLGGRQEFVKTTEVEYIWETRLEAVIDVAELDVKAAGFTTLWPGQPFIRTDLELSRKDTNGSWVWFATKVSALLAYRT